MKYSLKHVYIILLIILVSLLVFVIQGLNQQETKYVTQVEFKRIDGHNKDYGNMSDVQIKITNPDIINHNYTVNVSINSDFFTEEIVEVLPNKEFTFKIAIPLKEQIKGRSIEEAVSIISFAVYRDDRSEPIDRIKYKYD